MTTADMRALFAKSDGTDQRDILEAAWYALTMHLAATFEDRMELTEQWLKLTRAQAYTDMALLISEFVLPGWGVKSAPDVAEIGISYEPATPESDWSTYKSYISECLGKGRALAIIDAVCAAKGA